MAAEGPKIAEATKEAEEARHEREEAEQRLAEIKGRVEAEERARMEALAKTQAAEAARQQEEREDRRSAAEAGAREQQAKREAEARERQRLGIFGEESLREIVNAADKNTVRFERNYKNKTFSGVGAFKSANKANLGFGNSFAVSITLRSGDIVCFVDKSNADVVADWRPGTRVRFTGTISSTALLGGTLQLENCDMSAA